MLYLFNTASRKKEKFVPITAKTVKVYTCGPTVYNYAHIGNLATYLSSDFLKRYLRFSGYKVIDAMNFTDVDDKTIRASREKKVPLGRHTKLFEKLILKDFETLKIIKPKTICRATEHIKEMLDLIGVLVKKGFAYQAEDGSVYFRIAKFKDYGRFAGIDKKGLKAGASGRILSDEYTKENVSDFVLWKAWSEGDGDVFWDSPFGKGRPGWHIECSAMSMKYLGPSFDIHVGGADLIFPHHQNEIAQSEAATGKKFVNYWLHRGFLKIDREKMSKSLKNIFTLPEILEKVDDPMAFRFLVLTNHYRKPLNFSFDGLKSAQQSLDRLHEFVDRLKIQKDKSKDTKENIAVINKEIKKARSIFIKSLDDDLNAPEAIAGVFDLVNNVNKLIDKKSVGPNSASLVSRFIEDIDTVWGFLKEKKEKKAQDKDRIKELVDERSRLRSQKKWLEADKIKEKLDRMGVEIQDAGLITTWKIK